MTIPQVALQGQGRAAHTERVCVYLKVQCSAYHAPLPHLTTWIPCAASRHQQLNPPYNTGRDSEKEMLTHTSKFYQISHDQAEELMKPGCFGMMCAKSH